MSLKRKLNKMLLLYTSKKRCPRCPFSWASTIRWVWWWVCFFILSGLGTRLTGQSASRAVTLLFRSCKMFGTKVWTRLCAFLFSFFLFLFNIQIFNCRLFLLKCCLFRPRPETQRPGLSLSYIIGSYYWHRHLLLWPCLLEMRLLYPKSLGMLYFHSHLS